MILVYVSHLYFKLNFYDKKMANITFKMTIIPIRLIFTLDNVM